MRCFYAAFLGSAKKGKGKKGKSGSSAPAASDQKLNHSLDMIDAFSKLKVACKHQPAKALVTGVFNISLCFTLFQYAHILQSTAPKGSHQHLVFK